MPGEYDLLCERCGYQLDGLPTGANCSECGLAVAASLPEARAGSAWQRGPGAGSWLATLVAPLRRPREFWSVVRPECRRSISLLVVNLALGSMLATAAILIPGKVYKPASGFYAVLFFVVLFDVLLLLTLIEAMGIRFYGKRRRWRITWAVADAIVAHASVGWVIAGLGLGLGWHLWQRVDERTIGAWIRGVVGKGYFPDYDQIRLWTMVVVLLGGLLAGLMVFEFLVYFGFRRMRFANRARPAAEARNPGGAVR